MIKSQQSLCAVEPNFVSIDHARGIMTPQLEEQLGKVKTTELVQAHTFLENAVTTMKARAKLRDAENGERSMKSLVLTFNALTGHNLTEAEGWEFMVLLKMVRGRQGKFNDDDYVDMAAYSALLGECESTSKPRG